MHHLDLFAALLGAAILLLGLPSRWLQESPAPPTVLALFLGIVLGPEVLDLVDLAELGDRTRLLEGFARMALAIGLVGVALRIPKAYPRRNWRELGVLLAGGMLLMWAITTLLLWLLLPLPPLMAALVGAMLTATDPVAASPIVTGALAEKMLPERLRNLISAESGANDGLGYLIVFLPFLFLTRPAHEAWSHWLLSTLLYDVVVATLGGLALGVVAGRLLVAAERRGLLASQWRLVYTVALALLAAGGGRLLGGDELLVVFAAGLGFVQVVTGDDRKNEEHGQEAVNRFFAIPVLIAIGASIPWDGWLRLGVPGLLAAAAILLLRRLPTIALLQPWLPSVRGRADVLFVGWFGPIAVSAVYYATLMQHRTGESVIWDVASLVVCASVVAHGMTAAPFTRSHARRARGAAPDA